jgi:hypothetical protein
MTAKAPASTAVVAQELVALCREGRNLDAVNKLWGSEGEGGWLWAMGYGLWAGSQA